MTKLCPRGKAAAKRKFKVYPSAYANAYASKICAGKIKDPSGVKRKDFKGRKPAAEGGPITIKPRNERKKIMGSRIRKPAEPISAEKLNLLRRKNTERRKKMMGGGLMEATARLKRQGLKEGKSVKDVRKERALKSQKKTIDSITGFFNKATFGLTKPKKTKVKKMGGGMISKPRAMYRKGGGVCLRGMNREAVGKNS